MIAVMKLSSSLLKGFLSDELERTNRMLLRYSEQLKSYPKGSVYIKKSGKQKYLYRVHREDNRVISECLGNIDVINTEEIFMQSESRKNIENIISDLLIEKKDLEKILR